MNARVTRPGLSPLQALSSPVRQELLSALGDGAASARELAARMGRSRPAVHFHLGVLERSGLINLLEVRGSGRERERVYERAGHEPERGLRGSGDRLAADRAAGAMLRLTHRELSAAIQGRRGRPLAVRAKARLDERSETRARQLIKELLQLFAAAKGRHARRPVMSLTLVLTPGIEYAPRRSGGRR